MPTVANLFRDLTNRAGFQAQIEYDKDGDGYGGVTQDRCDTQAATIGPCDGPRNAPLPPPADGEPLPDDDVMLGGNGSPFDEPGFRFDPAPPAVEELRLTSQPRIARVFRARRGAVLRFGLSEPAEVTVSLQRLRNTRKAGRVAHLVRHVGAGPVKLRLRRRTDRIRLTAGRYRLQVHASRADGSSVRSTWVRFTVR